MLILLVIYAIHALCGWICARRFYRTRTLLDTLVAGLLHGFGTLYGFVILMGWITGMMNLGLVAVATIAAIALAAFTRLRLPHPDCSSAALLWNRLRRGGAVEWAIWLILVVQVIAIASVAFKLPARFADAAHYHSVSPVRWEQDHRFDLSAYDDPITRSSAGAAEVLPNVKALWPYLVMDITGLQDGTAAVQFPFIPLFLFGLYGLYRWAGLPTWAAAVALLFSTAATEWMMNITDNYADVMFYAGVYSSMLMILRLAEGRLSWRQLLLPALAFALLVGTKPQGIPVGGVLGLLTLVAAWIGRRAPDWKGNLRFTGATFALIVVTCFLIAGPWYMRGIMVYSNPIYPMDLKLGPIHLPGLLTQEASSIMAEARLKKSGLDAMWHILGEPYRHGIISPWDAGYGAQATVLGLPMLILFLCFGLLGPQWRRLLALTLLLVAISPGTGSPLIPRYNFYLLALMGLAFGWVLSRSSWFWRIPLLGIMLGLFTYNVIRVIPSATGRIRPTHLTAYVLFSGDYRPAQQSAFPDELRAVDWWVDCAPPGSLLAVIEAPAPVSLRSNVAGTRFTRVADAGEPIADWAAKLRDAGATHLLLPATHPRATAALGRADLFALILRGQGTYSETHLGMQPRPADVIFRVLPAAGGSQ